MKKFDKLLGLLALLLMGLAAPALAQTALTLNVAVSFAPAVIDTAGFSGSSTLTITLSRNIGGNLQAGSLALATVTYTGSMTNATAPTTTCGGTTTGGIGTNTIGLIGGSLTTALSCTLTATVSSISAGTNTVNVAVNAVTGFDSLFNISRANTVAAGAPLTIGATQAPTLGPVTNFGSVQVFTSSATTSNVTISYSSTFGPSYKIVSIASSNPADFTIDPATTCAIGPPGLPLPVGNCTYAIRFTPTTAPGPKTVTYTITDNAPGSPRTFTLTGTAIAGVPGAPVIGSATPGNAQATISYTPPTFDGGSPITGYTATCNPGTFSASGPSSALPLPVVGLTNGTTYTCSVTATNAIGTGPASAMVNVTPATVPGAPIIGAATPGSAQATIAFGAPTSNGGSAITGYTATCNPGTFSASGATSPLTVTGLTNGTTYTCSVTATNGVGTGPASATVNVTPAAAPTVPGAPTIGAATPGNSQATIAFTAPASNGGSPITGYTATCNPGALTRNGTASPLTFTGLTNGTTYTCSVTATNAVGTGPASASVNVTPAVVQVTVTPPSLAFGDVTVGSSSAPQAVTVTNGGTFPISVSVTPPTGPFPYSNGCPVFPMTLGNTSCIISVQFAPIVVGAGQSGVLNVVTTDAQNNSATFPVSLSGNGIPAPAPNATLTPAALDFGTQPVGTTSAAQSLILANSGNAALAVTSVTTSGAFAVQPATTPAGTIAPCAAAPFTLTPGTNCFMDVVFSPTIGGGATGSLVVSSNNAPPVSATFTGVGGEGRLIQISPSSFTFVDQVLNVVSAPQTFTVTNVGTQAVNITSLLVSSGATDFIVTHNCGVVNTLASGLGNNCSGAVTFQPSAIGARSGILSVVSNAQGSPHTLTPTGNALVQPFALLTTSASSLGFGQRGIANRSATQTIRVTNSGSVAVDISAIYTTGDFYQSHNCPTTLNSAQSCEVGAWFVPSIPGARAGELVIVNSSQDDPNRVGFRGTGCRFFTIRGSRLGQGTCKPGG